MFIGLDGVTFEKKKKKSFDKVEMEDYYGG